MRPLRLAAVAFLVGLLGLAHVHYALAFAGILWRESVLSWDNPATQHVEDLASQTVPSADGAREARDRTLLGARLAARVHLPEPPGRTAAGVVCRRPSRAPPAA